MSGNGWSFSSQSYHVQETEYFPFVCCWCQQPFMEIEALITHHEAHLTVLQNQVQAYYSATFSRPQRIGTLSLNPFRPLVAASNAAIGVSLLPAGQFSLPALGSSSGSRQYLAMHSPAQVERQTGTEYKYWPIITVTPRQRPVRPSPQMMLRRALIASRHSRAARGGQRELRQSPPPPPLPTPAVEEPQGQSTGPSGGVTARPDVGHPEGVGNHQHEQGNEALDLTLSLKIPFN